MLALSLSISTRGSPFLTSSPSFFSQRMILPVSIESESRGICTSGMGGLILPEQGFGGHDEVGLGREGELLQPLVVGGRDLGSGDPGHRGIQVVEGLFVDARRD